MRLSLTILLLAFTAHAQTAIWIDLNGSWRRSIDDRPEYAQPEFDDSAWRTSMLPRTARPVRRVMPNDAIPDIHWVRRVIVLPAELGGQPLTLTIGRPDDLYDLFVNGHRLPTPFPVDPQSSTELCRSRSYDIPSDWLRPGQPNVIALRLRRLVMAPTVRLSDSGPYLLTSTFAAPRLDGWRQLLERYVRYSPRLCLTFAFGLLGIVAVLLWLVDRRETELLWFAGWMFAFLIGALVSVGSILADRVPLSSNGFVWASILVIPTAPFGTAFVLSALRIRSVLLRAAPWVAWALYVFASAFGGFVVYGICGAISVGALLARARGTSLAWLAALGAPAIQQIILYAQTNILRLNSDERALFFGRVLEFPMNELAALVPAVAVLALMFRRMSSVHREQMRLAGELEAARTVQQILLPASAPAQTEAVYLPAAEVGGDFWHVFDDRLIVVGDVSGKGLKAAMIVSLITGALRNRRSDSPAALLTELNAVVQGSGGFVTCCVVRLEPDGRLTAANAGHPCPYLDGRELELAPSLPLGIVADVEYTETAVPFAGQLTLISDGVIEAANPSGELFGFERTRSISTQPAQAIAEAARTWGQNDDITVVTVQRNAAA